MDEKQLTEGLEKALEPIHQAHQDLLKKTIDCVQDAFLIGIEVGKKTKG